MPKILFAFLLLAAQMQSSAYSQSILGKFEITQINGDVVLNWVISKGYTCDGIDVERSYDGLSFVSIHNIEGICGSVDYETSYLYRDEQPFPNTMNYYRLKLGNDYSGIISVEVISLNDKGYLIKPHPVSDVSRLYFSNDLAAVHTVFLYSESGALISEQQVDGDYIELSAKNLPGGVYLFSILGEDGNKKSAGKIVVE